MTMEEKLKKDGWREYPIYLADTGIRKFYKMVETPTPCNANKDKDGVQFCVCEYDFLGIRYELTFNNETKEGWAVRFECYVDADTLDDRIAKFLMMWEN